MNARTGLAISALLIVAAGCGSDDSSSSSEAPTPTASAPPADTTPDTTPDATTAGTDAVSPETAAPTTDDAAPTPPTGDPIKLMVTGTHESAAVSYGQAVDAAEAAANAINASGGVNGSPIEILSCNDGLDPNQATACVQQGIDEKVTAFVGGLEVFNSAVLPMLEEARIAWVNPAIISPDQYTSPISYPVDGGAVISFVEVGRQAVEQGGPNVVVVQNENPNSAFTATFLVRGIGLAKGTVTKTVNYAIGQTDFSSTAADIVDSSPDGVVCACNAGDTAKLIQSLRQAGYDGPFGASEAGSPDPDLAAIGDAANNLIFTNGLQIFASDEPALAQFKEEVAGIDASKPHDNVLGLAWLGVHMVADLLEGAPSNDAATLIGRLDKADDLPTYGLVDKIDFTAPVAVEDMPRITNAKVLVFTWDIDAQKKVVTSDGFVDPFRP